MTQFPDRPSVFTSIGSPDKTRIFLVRQEPHLIKPPMLEQVASVSCTPELGTRLVSALNDAAWRGDFVALGEFESLVPSAAMQGMRAALSRCPSPQKLAIGAGKAPMSVLKEIWFTQGSTDFEVSANAAVDLGFQFIFENELDEDGRVELRVRILSDDQECAASQIGKWWAAPSDASVAERLLPQPSDFADVMNDPRWHRRRGRGYWLWIEDNDVENAHSAQWVIEFLDADLEPDRNFEVFIAGSGDSDGYLTERTRFLLWLNLRAICADLDSLCGEWDAWESSVREGMPTLVQDQPREWWLSLNRSADRLCESARRGDVEALVPRTPGEEAVIYLATSSDCVAAAPDWVELSGLEADFGALPEHEDDEIWDEVLGDLTGDVDIELMWGADAASRANPESPTNQSLGLGDYRPAAWHKLFERAIPHELPDLGT